MRNTPSISWQQIRTLAERWDWNVTDRQGRATTATGHNPPKGAKGKRQHPYFIKYITKNGHVEQGMVITCKVTSTARHQRMVKFVESGQVRIVNDLLVMQIDGFRVVAG